MKFDPKKVHRRFSLFLISSAVIACTFVQAFAVDDVRVTNWPTQYSIVNTTWDQRLATLQTTLQTQSANISTLVNRFGWNGTYTFSQGFELLYNDVHSISTASTQNDLLAAFIHEFNPDAVGTSKGKLQNIQSFLSGSTGSLISVISNTTDSTNSLVSHIDSDIHTMSAISSDIYDNVDTFRRAFNQYSTSSLVYESNISSKANQIKVDTGNISVDTEHISGTQDILVSQGAITMRNVGILRDFFADDDTIARKDAAEAASGEALDSFTGNGASSASVSDYADISDASTKLNQSFNTGQVSYVDAFQSINSQPTGNNSPWAWFSQATYDSINPQPSRGGFLSADSYMSFYEDQLASENRKGVSDTPLLDVYNSDIEKAIGK